MYAIRSYYDATRRQDYQNKFYYINGAIYLVNVDFFKTHLRFIQEQNTSFYIMPQENGIDIDEYNDLKRAEIRITSYNVCYTKLLRVCRIYIFGTITVFIFTAVRECRCRQ